MAKEDTLKRCAYCGGGLGLISWRRWSLRFCSQAHKKAYEHREREEREKRIKWFAFLYPRPP